MLSRRLFAVSLTVVILGLMLFVSASAMAANADPTSASVTFSNAQVTPFTMVSAGGGTWQYGTALVGTTGKHVWSYYHHSWKYHSATAVLVDMGSRKVYAAAHNWAYADFWGSNEFRGQAYWNTY